MGREGAFSERPAHGVTHALFAPSCSQILTRSEPPTMPTAQVCGESRVSAAADVREGGTGLAKLLQKGEHIGLGGLTRHGQRAINVEQRDGGGQAGRHRGGGGRSSDNYTS